MTQSKFIIIHCGGLPFNGDTLKTESLGGSETAAYYMARGLADSGHKVTLFTNHPNDGEFDGVRYVWAGQPTEQHPLGERFHHYAANTPSDVLIIQRAPLAFKFQWASKVNLLWMHDLALVRQRNQFLEASHNINGILTVSEYHKEQICKTWEVNPDIVYPITNGVDLSLYTGDGAELPARVLDRIPAGAFLMTYSSRPERGLENLVRPGGIMHQLWESGLRDIHLVVCGYDNTTPQMADYYQMLWDACDALPNVTNVGPLTKQELANLQRSADLHVYPTKFEEVSCITAMECMAAGLPFLSSEVAALPETCRVSKGVKLLPLKDGEVDVEKFISAIRSHYNAGDSTRNDLSVKQREAGEYYSWAAATARLELVFDVCFAQYSPSAILRQFIRNSDIAAAVKYYQGLDKHQRDNAIVQNCMVEIETCYRFYFDNTFDEHYAAYYQYEEERGSVYGPEEVAGQPRFESVSKMIEDGTQAGDNILDYGCAHGHYTIALAKRFPDRQFVGVDITKTNIDKARAWAQQEGLTNVSFFHGRVHGDGILVFDEDDRVKFAGHSFAAIIAAEVIEHVADPIALVEILRTYLVESGLFVITTPYGPWEAIGYEEHWPWRAHLWHFERSDIHDLFGRFPAFKVLCVPSGHHQGEAIGCYVYQFQNTADCQVGRIDYQRKFANAAGRQTVSLCMVVKNAESSLLAALRSVKSAVDEIHVYIDPSDNGKTEQVVEEFEAELKRWPIVRSFAGLVATEVGFDAARNDSILRANGDWILWIDADEVMNYPERMYQGLRPCTWEGWAIPQHHFSMEPLGVMKTDFPVRLFRNHRGIRFFGVVHEHPEKEINEGVGHAKILPGVDIAHHGYQNEQTRRGRFHRNIRLMARDRKQYPERLLGKFLWMRDLAQMNGYELERNGGRLDDEIISRAKEGMALWDDLLERKQIRMLVDGIEFHNRCSGILGAKFELSFKIDTSEIPGGTAVDNVVPITGLFLSEEEANKFISTIIHERVKDYGSKYA